VKSYFKVFFILFLFALLIQTSNSCLAQGKKQSLEQIMEWLEIQLHYSYFKAEENNWWYNNFEFYQPDSSIIFKNIFRDGPRIGGEKIYYKRSVKLKDINPSTIRISKSRITTGRFTEGKIMVLNTIHREKLVTKTVNNRFAAKESAIRVMFPDFLLDSIPNLSEKVKAHFQIAIRKINRLKVSDLSQIEKVSQVFRSLEGRFFWEKWNEAGNEEPAETGIRKYLVLFNQDRLEIQDSIYGKPYLQNKILMGYDQNNKNFYHFVLSSEKSSPEYLKFQLAGKDNLKLVGRDNLKLIGDEFEDPMTNATIRQVIEILNNNEHYIYYEKLDAKNSWIRADFPYSQTVFIRQ